MKFVLEYSDRGSGSVQDNLAAAESAQKLLSNWAPNPAATIHQWVQRCDGSGGFAVLETDDAGALYKDLATWSPWLEFQLHPVLDILDTVSLNDEALAISRSVL
jgi:hypothetical protein